MSELMIDGRPMSTFGLTVSGLKVFDAPDTGDDLIDIPGRNGAYILPSRKLENITVEYDFGITGSFAENAAALRVFLGQKTGYRRLVDSYNPGEYRLGKTIGGLQFTTTQGNRQGEATIKFTCKPQRFLLPGEQGISVTAPMTLRNFWMPAEPVITVLGSGSGYVNIGAYTIEIKRLIETLTIDCARKDCYKAGIPWNDDIILPDLRWPVLWPGENPVSFAGDIRSLIIVPNWWTP